MEGGLLQEKFSAENLRIIYKNTSKSSERLLITIYLEGVEASDGFEMTIFYITVPLAFLILILTILLIKLCRKKRRNRVQGIPNNILEVSNFVRR